MVAELRCWTRFTLACLLYYSGLISLWSLVRRRLWANREVCVLGFHRVLASKDLARSNSLDSIVMRQETFAKVLEFLSKRYCALSLEMFLNDGSLAANHSKPRCLITFDDGWKDTYTTAYPLLKRFKMPVTIFLTAGFIDGQKTFWTEQLAHAWRDASVRQQACSQLERSSLDCGADTRLEEIVEYLKHMPSTQRERILTHLLPTEGTGDLADEADQMMTWHQVREMSQDGINFGAHTVTHPLLTFEEDATVEGELRQSKQTIEEKLGKRVRAFAYPNGNWDKRIRRWVEQVGFECAFDTRSGQYRRGQDRYTIRRILLHEGNVTGPKRRFSPAMLSFTLARWR
jgi:peptidoglycan/xylan/chitin deacetylase (PgdA/CDA1 family)